MPSQSDERPTLLLVDDETTNLKIFKQVLNQGYRLVFAKSGTEALRLVEAEHPQLILLDVMMPGMTGFDVCRTLKSRERTKNIPVIFVTALNDEMDETRGLELGAVDYITKPLSPAIVRARVRIHLSLIQADKLQEERLQLIHCLGRAAEYKDNETGRHVIRVGYFSRVLALASGLSPQRADDLLHAALLHDIGKIGIPDRVLLKPGKLDEDEMTEMREHPAIGARILGDSDSGLLQLAKTITMTHHEKYDGSGYPQGLVGEEIPLEGRIVAIADVFDALTSRRPYKEPWPLDKALEYFEEQRGRHFDPEMVSLLFQELEQICAIKKYWQDERDSQ